VSPVRYELGFYIPEDDILHSHRRENFKSYMSLPGWTLSRICNVSPVKYDLGFYIPEDDILQITAVKTLNLTYLYIRNKFHKQDPPVTEVSSF
jgi:hypothetical protein